MPHYEIMCIATATAPSSHLVQLFKKAGTVLQQRHGVFRSIEHFGLRPLAYRMRAHAKYNEVGRYIRLRVQANPSALKEFEHRLKVDEQVVRFMTFKHELAPKPKDKAKDKEREREREKDTGANGQTTTPNKKRVGRRRAVLSDSDESDNESAHAHTQSDAAMALGEEIRADGSVSIPFAVLQAQANLVRERQQSQQLGGASEVTISAHQLAKAEASRADPLSYTCARCRCVCLCLSVCVFASTCTCFPFTHTRACTMQAS